MSRILLVVLALLLAGCNGGGADPRDKDLDGVDDDVEVEGTFIEIVLPKGTERRKVTAEPGVKDTDGDGLLDGEEMLARGTDPRDVDTDGDGLLDGADRVPPNDATRDDWRARGILEVNGTFLGELNACGPGGPQLRPNAASSDLPFPDELLDGEELRGWDVTLRGATRHVSSDPCSPDTDGDGLLDHDEKLLRTDPRAADTDGDGAPDGSDADPLADLALRFFDAEVRGANASSVRLVFSLGAAQAHLVWPGNGSAVVDVDDRAPDRRSLPATLTLAAEETATGKPVALFADARGVILAFDLIAGTASGATLDGDALRFSGADGSLSLRFETLRR